MGQPKGTTFSIGVGIHKHKKKPKPIVVVWPIGTPANLSQMGQNLNMGSIGLANCGHPATPAVGSVSVREMGLGSHRVGDVGVVPKGFYVLATGAMSVLAGV